MQSIVLLFGAGTSVPAGMPCTSRITENVLSGEGFATKDETYYRGKSLYAHMGWPDAWVPRLSSFLQVIKAEIAQHLGDSGDKDVTVTYEDLNHFLNQLFGGDWLGFRRRDASVVQPMKDRLAADPRVIPLYKHPSNQNFPDANLGDLVRRSMDYIKDVVWELLRKEPQSLPYLALVEDCLASKELNHVCLCTLNHDFVLLRHLQTLGIEFTDGFEAASNGLRVWNPSLFEDASKRLFALHLHGSILWHWYQETGQSGFYDLLIKCENVKLDVLRLFRRPSILVGTDNKMADYQKTPFTELNCFFNASLRKSKTAIVSGYGFGDQGINASLMRWLYSSNAHRMAIIDPSWKYEEAWSRFQESRQIVVFPRAIQDAKWYDVLAALHAN